MATLTSAQALRATTTTTTKKKATTTTTTTTTMMMQRRDAVAPGTVCGYIGGDSALPATCIAGSHCALDVAHGVVGCCPDDGPCSTGVFTSCVDGNSGPQTVSDPYVYTCRGGKVCYRNVFDGGFYQFGCGSESRLATSVATAAPVGLAPLAMAQVTLAMTERPTVLATPVDVGASFTAAETSSGVGGKNNKGGANGDGAGSGGSPSSTSGPDSAPPSDSASPPTGAIVGGTVGGVAAVAALLALVVFAFRRRRRRPIKKALMDSGNNKADGNNNHHHHHDDDDVDVDDDDFRSVPYSPKMETGGKKQMMMVGGATAITTTTTAAAAAAATTNNNKGKTSSSSPPLKMTPRFGNTNTNANANANAIHAPAINPARIPLATSATAFDDPRPAPRPGSVIVEEPGEDEVGDEANDDVDDDDAAGAAYPGPRRNGSGALWQQNRMQRRNLVWI
ncbi:hypothetical protein CP532_0099 [Ophiocordyceps camponoti-leonardi (nom. inval.)]|nr:hypothetical protein CP532_0099 [Ophiocordyceps camponoti-leonardi (nom. inval.)]